MNLAELTLDGLRQTIAEQLQIAAEDIQDDDNLFMLGLDSMSLMTLVGHWRALGLNVEFQDLVEEPTLNAWQDRLKIAAE